MPPHQTDPIGISVSQIDIKTFQSNNNGDHTLGVAGLCEIGIVIVCRPRN